MIGSLVARRLARGRCRCGAQRVPGDQRCARHVKRDRAAQRARWERLREAGRCMRCGAPPELPGRSKCARHAEIARKYQRQLRAERKAAAQ